MVKKNTFFRNYTVNKKKLKEVMSWAFNNYGGIKASYLADELKDIGFRYATQAGISLSIEDLRVPPAKKLLMESAYKTVQETELGVNKGELTEVERFQQVINTWNSTSETLKEEVIKYFTENDPLNSIYMMAFSGARGNISQVRQLVGMRGLMADPNGQIIDLPITTNFREGLTITDYLISSYGARKGLVDTALRTADSGYLTRRLIDVAQDIITRERDCSTKYGITLTDVVDGNNIIVSTQERLIGRILAKPILKLKTKEILYNEGTLLTEEIVTFLIKKEFEKLSKIVIRSPLTCLSRRSVCQYCYGWNLAYRALIDLGEAVGIIAAQSIGEPGTQLTMRTFHTGGVFTSEPTRQVVAKFSGQIQFASNLKIRLYRTQTGSNANICENESFINLLTYENKLIKIKVQPDTIIFVQNNSFVKKNEVILEFASQIRKIGEEKAFKEVFAKQSGEIIRQDLNSINIIKTTVKNNTLIWLLAGTAYEIPVPSRLMISPGQKLTKGRFIAQLQNVNRTGGFLNYDFIENKPELTNFEIIHQVSALNNAKIYISKNPFKQLKCVLYGSKNQQINLNLREKSNILTGEFPYIGHLQEKIYTVKTGGGFYSKNYSSLFNEEDENKNLDTDQDQELVQNKDKNQTVYQKIGGTILYIPEFTHTINSLVNELNVKRGSYVLGKTIICKNTVISEPGIIDFVETKEKELISKVSIKPGRIITLEGTINSLKYHQQILYPGEIILNKIQIKRLSFSEIKYIDSKKFLWIYPIIRYELSNPPFNSLNFSNNVENIKEFSLDPIQLNVEINNKVERNSSFSLGYRKLSCHSLTYSKNLLAKNEIQKLESDDSKFIFNLNISERINPIKEVINVINLKETEFVKKVQPKQYVEPFTILSVFPTKSKSESEFDIVALKEQYSGNKRKLLIIGSNSYKTFYFEDKYLNLNFNSLTKIGEKIGSNLETATSGLIKEKQGNKILLRIGEPYLFSAGASIRKYEGDLIKKGEILGQLLYERAKTGDIVQGLPRVEEILEARKPKVEAILSSQPAIINQLESKDNLISIFVVPPNLKNISSSHFYSLPSNYRLLIGKLEFINVGQPLNDNSINPHVMLDTLFLYYQTLKILTPYQSAYRSLRKIQALLINSIQSVYYSQGVAIADKHIEIIVKQMTGKVQVVASGQSPLLLDELLELEQIDYINRCLGDKEHSSFKPILLGITKASLKTDSFISAASFQHTTRILTEAAVQGKIDWLRGLKENVIVGRLIPSGTGFNAYSDISYIGAKIPSIENIIQKDYSSRKIQTKYKQLKKRIKFL